MRTTVPESCGLLVWGTKRGLQPFFSFGVEADTSSLSGIHGDNDIRNHNIRLGAPYNRVFYGIDRVKDHCLVHQFRTVIDEVERPGFYAVTLVVPSDKRLPDGQCLRLLNRLSDLYHDTYVKTSGKPDQIRLNAVEDPFPFGSMIRSPEFILVSDMPDRVSSTVARKAFLYSSIDELSGALDRLGRSELRSVEKLFLLQDSLRDLLPKDMAVSGVPLPVPKLDMELSVSSQYGDAIDGAEVLAKVNGVQYEMMPKGRGLYILSGIGMEDNIEINIRCNGYQPKTISPSDTSRYMVRHAGNHTLPIRMEASLFVQSLTQRPTPPKDPRLSSGPHRPPMPEYRWRRYAIPLIILALVGLGTVGVIMFSKKLGPEEEPVSEPISQNGSGNNLRPIDDEVGPSSADSMGRINDWEARLNRLKNGYKRFGNDQKIPLQRIADTAELLKKDVRSKYGESHPMIGRINKLVDSVKSKIDESRPAKKSTDTHVGGTVKNPKADGKTEAKDKSKEGKKKNLKIQE